VLAVALRLTMPGGARRQRSMEHGGTGVVSRCEYGGNSAIQKREWNRTHTMHKDRIRNIKPGIDNTCPVDQPHLTTYGRDYFAKKKMTTEAAFNDLKMIQSIARTMTRPFPYDLQDPEVPHSLNRDWRKREQYRITMENHKLLGRLCNLRPYYSTKRLADDHAKNQKYVVNSSWTARKLRMYDVPELEDGDQEYYDDGDYGDDGMPHSQSAPNLHSGHSTGDKLPPIGGAAM